MSRIKKQAEEKKVNVNGWMVSYADMVTILLAMFIALSALTRDQTGLTFLAGTGSFRDRIKSFGIPGFMPNSSHVIQHHADGPLYSIEEEDPPVKDPLNLERIIDGDQERLKRFLRSLRSEHALGKLPSVTGETSVDFYTPLRNQPPMLGPEHEAKLTSVLSLLVQQDYRIHVVVWAGSPGESACIKAVEKAIALREEIGNLGGLDEVAKRRLLAVGRSWLYRDIRRPYFSLVIFKQKSMPGQ